MTIPDFQSIMLPLLMHLRDGKEHTNREVIDYLSSRFGLIWGMTPTRIHPEEPDITG